MSNKSRTTALLLCLFLGGFGAHRFYVGKTGTAVFQLILSLSFIGLFISGIWAFIDLIMIATGNFTDDKGETLATW
jgi:TM2 domain-containing membrane protein YozV